MDNGVPQAKNKNDVKKFDVQRPKPNNSSEQILALAEYVIVVMLVHFVIFVITLFVTSNEDYRTLMGALLFGSIVIFVGNYKNNPYPIDELDVYDLSDEQFSG